MRSPVTNAQRSARVSSALVLFLRLFILFISVVIYNESSMLLRPVICPVNQQQSVYRSETEVNFYSGPLKIAPLKYELSGKSYKF